MEDCFLNPKVSIFVLVSCGFDVPNHTYLDAQRVCARVDTHTNKYAHHHTHIRRVVDFDGDAAVQSDSTSGVWS
jgi:hypothetical protein